MSRLSWQRTVGRMGLTMWTVVHEDKSYLTWMRTHGDRLWGHLSQGKKSIASEDLNIDLGLLPFQDPDWKTLHLAHSEKLIRWAEGFLLSPMELLSDVLQDVLDVNSEAVRARKPAEDSNDAHATASFVD